MPPINVKWYACAAAALLDVRLYVVGGERTSAVERFDAKEGSWELVVPTSSMRNGYVGSALYAIGVSCRSCDSFLGKEVQRDIYQLGTRGAYELLELARLFPRFLIRFIVSFVN
eukprot:gb/GEZN01006272.1/.p1 GENE.gb/GEZN01006272.1/~~gb/GEZN01006272.1/.p1  ORF type:complete len:114 (+),score=8.78 gb/GEZN01006272.1/:827-1168(+)